MKSPAFRHIGIYVSDMELMKKFYMECFELIEKSQANEGGDYLRLLLNCPDIALENVKFTDGRGMILELLKTQKGYNSVHSDLVCREGCIHIAFTVPNVDEIKRMVVRKGGEALSECLISPDGKAKVVFCKDPEGNYLELVEELQ